MSIRIAGLILLLLIAQRPSAHAQGTPAGNVGWYTGDCQSTGTGGWSNWYLSDREFTRVYDDFTVPTGGWTVLGVFSNNQLSNAPAVTQASWEIRSGVSAGSGGAVIASGVSPATQTYNPGLRAYLIAVIGLQVSLAPGKYSLSVTPVGPVYRQSYVCETTGGGGVGELGSAFYAMAPGIQFNLLTGAGGRNLHFSQGVLIPAAPPETNPIAQWQSNLAYLAQQMPRVYFLPFPGIGLAEFNASIAELSARVPTLSEAQIRTGLQSIVASIGDPHTDVGWGAAPFRYVPLSYYWFDDGIYVTAARSQYQNLLGGKLTSVGQTGIDEVIRKLTPLVPHENDSWVKYQLPIKYLNNTDFLFGTGVIDSTDAVPIAVQTLSGESGNATLDAGASGQMIPLFQGTLPLYRQHADRYYWATAIDDGATVYFQYNHCDQDRAQPSTEFFQELDQMLADESVQRLVVDMRNNPGGFVSTHNAWIDQIKSSRFNLPGRLYIIVGRNTFSAAIDASDRFRDETAATFVGEPTGGKPRFMVRGGDFGLPYFGIRVSYSRGVRQTRDDGPTLTPDIVTGLTFQQYMEGADPALDAILRIPLPGN